MLSIPPIFVTLITHRRIEWNVDENLILPGDKTCLNLSLMIIFCEQLRFY